MDSRFALRNYKGDPIRFFLVNTEDFAGDATATQTSPTHHIFVVDASGSMWGSMRELSQTIEKLLTLEEYKDADTLISLISYASNGDIRTHFARARVADINSPGSAYVEEIRKLRTRGLTCMSQALDKAKELVHDGELTCISLHSDGYANDRSPTLERREIDRICKDLSALDNVFVNTIAYNRWSDFKLLSAIANSCSGTCIQAMNIKQVFDALHDTTNLLAGQQAPAVACEIGDYDYQVFVSTSANKVNGASTYLAIRGLKPDDTKTVYRYKEVNEAAYNASTADLSGAAPILAYSRTQLAEGNINASKFAMVAVRDATLLDTHAKALTSEDIAAMCAELETCLFNGIPSNHVRTTDYGLDTSQMSVLSLVGLLSTFANSLSVNLTELRGHYQKRGVRRVAGVRQDDGTIEVPWLDTQYKDDSDFVSVSSFDINRNTASINMLVNRGIDLVERDSRNVIASVASVDVSGLKSFNNYTLVGDGSLNIDHLDVRISSKKAFRALVAAEVLSGDYDPNTTYTIVFEGRPLVDYDQDFADITGVFNRLARYKVLSSLLGALSKGSSVDYTPDQVTELKRHYLSPALFVSFPSTNEYADKDEALAQGIIDTRLSYKVDIGNSTIINQKKLKSANAYLARRFAIEADGEAQKKPTMLHWWADDFSVSLKKLTARTKLDAVDDLTMPYFEEFLNLGTTGFIGPVLEDAGADAAFVARFADLTSRNLDKDEAVEVVDEASLLLKRATDRLYRDKVCPVAFYIGSTGLLPDEFDTKALTAEQLVERYPTIKLAKAEKEGTFFDVGDSGDVIITVFVKGEYFSTGAQPAVAAAAK